MLTDRRGEGLRAEGQCAGNPPGWSATSPGPPPANRGGPPGFRQAGAEAALRPCARYQRRFPIHYNFAEEVFNHLTT